MAKKTKGKNSVESVAETLCNFSRFPCDIVERLGKGDPFCRVVLWKKKKD